MTTLQYSNKIGKLEKLLSNYDFKKKSNRLILGSMTISQDEDFIEICFNENHLVRFKTVKSAYEFIYYN